MAKFEKVEGGDVYRVYRKVKSGGWKYIDSTKSSYFTDKTAKSGKTFRAYFRITGIGNGRIKYRNPPA